MGCCMDGMCLELWGGDILSVKKAEMSVPLQFLTLLTTGKGPNLWREFPRGPGHLDVAGI